MTTVTSTNGRTTDVQLHADRVASPIEAVALCDEVGAAVSRLEDAITVRSWQDVFDETIQLGALVKAYRVEFRRLAGAIERGQR